MFVIGEVFCVCFYGNSFCIIEIEDDIFVLVFLYCFDVDVVVCDEEIWFFDCVRFYCLNFCRVGKCFVVLCIGYFS